MKLLHFTDLHNNYGFIDRLETEIQNADGIIISGDLTTFGPTQNAVNVLEKLKSFNENLMVIPGNCDPQEVKDILEESGLSIDRRAVSFKGYQIAGLGGSLPCPTPTPNQYSEMEVEADLEEFRQFSNPDEPLILVYHQPPYQTIADQVSPGFHVGSEKIRDFIEAEQPLLCLCGHIHEGIGEDKVGDTLVLNPGPAMDGYYAELNLNEKDVSVELKRC